MLGASRISYLALSQVLAQEEVAYRAESTITPSGDAQIDTTQSKFGGASVLFDGTSDYLTADITSIGTGDFTIEGWVRLNVKTKAGIFTISDGANDIFVLLDTNNDYGFLLYSPNVSPSVLDAKTGGTSYTNTNANQWYHIALTREGTSVKLWLNGQLMEAGTSSANFDGTQMLIGTTSGSADFWNGWMDEIRLSNVARYSSNFTPSTEPFANDNNTLMLLHFDGSDGSTTFIDDNGLTRSAVGVYASGSAVISTDQNKFGGASCYIDNTVNASYLACAGDTQYDVTTTSGARTFEGWFYNNDVNSTDAIFGNRTTGSGTVGWVLWMVPSGNLRLIGWDSSNTNVLDITTTTSPLSNNTWHHIAYVWDGTSSHKVYVDGSLEISGTESNVGASPRGFIIGDDTGGSSREWNGYIDEIRVSDTERYTSTFTAPTDQFTDDSNTLLLLHMDQYADGTQFIDDNGQTLPSYSPSYDRPINVTSVNGAYVSTSASVFGGASYKGLTGKWLEAAMLPPSGDFTIEYRVRIDSRSANSGHWEFANGSHYIKIFSGEVGGTIKNIGVQITDTGGNLILNYASPGGSFPDSTFVFIALTYVASTQTFRVYMNGTLRLNQVVSGFTMPDTTTLRIGSAIVSGSDRYARGYIDEFRVSNTARYTGSSLTVPSSAYTNDADTALLLHMDGANLSTVFTDDNS